MTFFYKNKWKSSKRARGQWRGPRLGRCCHLMGRQLWFAAEYVVVERANSPTREQRRGDVVSGMVTIRGLTLP